MKSIWKEEHQDLTHKQRFIVSKIALGFNRKQIAEMAGISVKTVDYHMIGDELRRKSCIAERLGFSDTARLTHYAIQNGLVSLGECFKK